MTQTISKFEATKAPCGHRRAGERTVSEDQQGLVTEERARTPAAAESPRRSSTTAASTGWS